MMFFEKKDNLKCHNKPYRTVPSFVFVFLLLIAWKCKELQVWLLLRGLTGSVSVLTSRQSGENKDLTHAQDREIREL